MTEGAAAMLLYAGPHNPSDLRDINTVLFLSDDAPEGFSRSLNHIPQADKVRALETVTEIV